MTKVPPPGRAVVTGIGVVNGAGSNAKAYWETLASGQVTGSQAHLFGSDQPAQHVMRVDDDMIDHGWPGRHTKRLDRLVMLASAAVREALSDAELCTGPDSDRIGLFVGNATGGWTYVEPQLYPLYRDHDLDAVNPYVATAWFPTASQGELSIAHGLGGYSKTFSAENLSSAFALRQACWALDTGLLDIAIVCGAEAPLTPLVHNACVRTGLVSLDGHYDPYSFEADGSPLGEGAAALVLERAADAEQRRVAPRADVAAPALGKHRAKVLNAALLDAGLDRVDYVALEGRAQTEPDVQEMCAVETALHGELPPMSVATGTSGALLGASFLTSVVASVLAVDHAAIPGGTRVHAAPRDGLRVLHNQPAQQAPLRSALVLATDAHEQTGAVVVTAPDTRPPS